MFRYLECHQDLKTVLNVQCLFYFSPKVFVQNNFRSDIYIYILDRNEIKIPTEMPAEFWFVSVPNDEL